MKVLFTASVADHLERFHMPYIQYFKEKGFEVHTAARGGKVGSIVEKHFDIPFERSPLSPKNLECYGSLKKIINENHYDIIHCHTPVVSVLTRLAARKSRKDGTVVIYTAHGFHFYDGAPCLKSLLFRTIEKNLCRYTDHLITINNEDYAAIARFHFKPGAYYNVHGVGVDASRFTAQIKENKREARTQYGIDQKAYVLIFAGEYIKRKNQKMLIETMRLLKTKIPAFLLLLPGEGPQRQEYEGMIKNYGLEDNVRLLGFRRDMDSLLLAADVAVSSSIQEGLGINIVEAMAVSLPVVSTRIRGPVDLVEDGINGYLVDVNDVKAMANRLLFLYENPDIAKSMSRKTSEIVKPFLLENAKAETIKIYDSIIQEKMLANK